MTSPNPNPKPKLPITQCLTDPMQLASKFQQWIRALVQITLWSVIGLTCLSGAFVALRFLWWAVLYAWNAISN